ncbi:hypothetical protein ABW20_dc0106224 [Dactylellina cionopaga]|nr:hypothetical protein ABW20_dc0106224 [Dactylellina cionopaga]
MVIPTDGFALVPAGERPDIAYHPDPDKYRSRTALRLQAEPDLPQTPLPFGFPTRIEGPIVWEGKDWTDEKQWVYQLNVTELKEIEDALTHFKTRELYSGRGFFVLRTLPVDSYSKEDVAIVYAGIASYIGNRRGRQDGTGAVLGHIKDLRHTHDINRIGNTSYTTEGQVYHTDYGDLISLLALEVAAEGGTSRLCSSGRIYNELATTRPDLVKTLSEPWPFDNFFRDPLYYERPILFHEDSKIILQFSRRNFTGYGMLKRNPDIPPLSEAQAEALDAMQYIAEKHALALNFRKGDIQFINSLGLLHARDAFKDDPEHTRHLLRIWLRDDEFAWKTPKPLVATWGRLYDHTPDSERFPLVPEIRSKANGVAQ